MRMIILSALFAVGVGLTGIGAASASPIGSGIGTAAESGSLLQDIQYYRRDRRCRSVTVCRRGSFGRRCHVERVCRR
jgi:hypothetical protein